MYIDRRFLDRRLYDESKETKCWQTKRVAIIDERALTVQESLLASPPAQINDVVSST